MGSYVKQLKSDGLSSCETHILEFQRGMYYYAENVNCSWNLTLLVEEKKKNKCIKQTTLLLILKIFLYFGRFHTLCLLMQDFCIPLNLSVKALHAGVKHMGAECR